MVVVLVFAGVACIPVGSSTSGSASSSSGASSGPRDAGPRPDARAPGCMAVAPTSCDNPALRYSDVAPIISNRCHQCHSAAANISWPLEAYEHLADWHDDIRADLVNCTMPPDDAGIPFSEEERNTVLMWIRCGYPE